MNEIVRILIFAVIGVWNTLFDFVLFYLFYRLLEKAKVNLAIKNASIAHVFSYSTATLVSYYLNKTFTFSDSQSDLGLAAFVFVSLFSLIISTAFIQILNHQSIIKAVTSPSFFWNKISPDFLHLNEKKWVLVTKLISTLVSMTTNYVGYRFIVFR